MIGFTALSTHVASYHTEIKIKQKSSGIVNLRAIYDINFAIIKRIQHVPGTLASLHKLQTNSIVSSGRFPSRQTNGLLTK